MKKLAFVAISAAFLLPGCNDPAPPETSEKPDADTIVNRAIETSGGEQYQTAHISFDFRDIHYTSKRNNGLYEFSRTRTDSAGNVILDCIDNHGFQRTVNGNAVSLPDSLARLYSNSINSVHYFVQLPYGLNDAAVNKTLLDTVSLKGSAYYKIKVVFDEDGGGEDHEDVYLYWFDRTDYSLDFLAYSFHTDGGGMRFREAFNEREKGGIVFRDYRNYKPVNPSVDFYALDSLFEADQLQLLSVIENENIEVTDSTDLLP